MAVFVFVILLFWESFSPPPTSRAKPRPSLQLATWPWMCEEALNDHGATDTKEYFRCLDTTTWILSNGSSNLSDAGHATMLSALQAALLTDDMYGPQTESEYKSNGRKDIIIQELRCRLSEMSTENALLREQLEAAYWCLGPLMSGALVWRWAIVLLTYWFLWPVFLCCCCCCFYCVDQFEWVTRR